MTKTHCKTTDQHQHSGSAFTSEAGSVSKAAQKARCPIPASRPWRAPLQLHVSPTPPLTDGSAAFLVLVMAALTTAAAVFGSLYAAVALVIGAVVIWWSLTMANTWPKLVVLLAGKVPSVKATGLIDERIHITAFNAEQVLTRDTVPVNVDAFIFWHVHDVRKAAPAITDYRQAIERVAQTSLREMIGSSMLAALLCDRLAVDWQLCEEIGRKTVEWGVTVRSAEIGGVAIPAALQAEHDARLLVALRLSLARHRARAAEAQIADTCVQAIRQRPAGSGPAR